MKVIDNSTGQSVAFGSPVFHLQRLIAGRGILSCIREFAEKRRAEIVGEVHLWGVDVDLIDRWEVNSSVSDAEAARATRLRGCVLSSRFLAGRAFVRHILAGYLGRNPRELDFVIDGNGKPREKAYGTTHEIDFNLTHAGNVAVCAIVRGGPVGVDIEECTQASDLIASADRILSPTERGGVLGTRETAADLKLLQCWVKKEAVLKGLGLGLSAQLNSFDVLSVQEGRPTAQVEIEGIPHPGPWRLSAFDSLPGYAGAIFVRGEVVTIRVFEARQNAVFQLGQRSGLSQKDKFPRRDIGTGLESVKIHAACEP